MFFLSDQKIQLRLVMVTGEEQLIPTLEFVPQMVTVQVIFVLLGWVQLATLLVMVI